MNHEVLLKSLVRFRDLEEADQLRENIKTPDMEPIRVGSALPPSKVSSLPGVHQPAHDQGAAIPVRYPHERWAHRRQSKAAENVVLLSARALIQRAVQDQGWARLVPLLASYGRVTHSMVTCTSGRSKFATYVYVHGISQRLSGFTAVYSAAAALGMRPG